MQTPVQPPAAAAPLVPPTPAIAPATPLAADPVAVPAGGPRTSEQLAALRAHRSEVSDQLASAQHRRDQLARELRQPMGPASGADRTGIEQRLTVLDGRIINLERDLNATGQLIAAAPASLQHVRSDDPAWARYSDGRRSGVGLGFGLGALAVLLWTRVVRRRRPSFRDAERSAPPAADSARLARVEQAVEAVAIEVERISEGQRFVTQLLAEQRDEARVGGPVGVPAFGAAPGEYAEGRPRTR